MKNWNKGLHLHNKVIFHQSNQSVLHSWYILPITQPDFGSKKGWRENNGNRWMKSQSSQMHFLVESLMNKSRTQKQGYMRMKGNRKRQTREDAVFWIHFFLRTLQCIAAVSWTLTADKRRNTTTRKTVCTARTRIFLPLSQSGILCFDGILLTTSNIQGVVWKISTDEWRGVLMLLLMAKFKQKQLEPS